MGPGKGIGGCFALSIAPGRTFQREKKPSTSNSYPLCTDISIQNTGKPMGGRGNTGSKLKSGKFIEGVINVIRMDRCQTVFF
jgi:hypothetical protein